MQWLEQRCENIHSIFYICMQVILYWRRAFDALYFELIITRLRNFILTSVGMIFIMILDSHFVK